MSIKSGKEKHPLYNSWAAAKKSNTLCQSWREDFWLFVSDILEVIGERPLNSCLKRKETASALSKENCFWYKQKLSIKDFDSRNAYMREYNKNNPDKVKHGDLKKRFGISLATYQKMLIEQGNVCRICGNPETIIDNRTQQIRALAVDHNHKTGIVRGLLCMGCNQGIGNFKEEISRLQKAIEYLERNS